jgi:hypothetical protein
VSKQVGVNSPQNEDQNKDLPAQNSPPPQFATTHTTTTLATTYLVAHTPQQRAHKEKARTREPEKTTTARYTEIAGERRVL